MNKLTPQQYLDSTIYNYLTKDSTQSNFPYLLHVMRPYKMGDRWKSNSGNVNLLFKDIESIDWNGFDTDTIIVRTK